ncbi:cupin domain-containing protein [Amylibacter sp. IMCC11727]|uniref:cupin domain-containing protein n=1 Tax=Amylibacter sp. IMCC11727 TaxID=3039851 RepID=UPI00244DBA61|nr:cupin domain-containing protein [Amylibacter sp. IMCC11727]WGI21517.1 cupin domain-containing protein [Amylibacter sp. IMCC11727]
MDLNADFSKRVVVHSDQVDWVKSPMPGVDRRMLDRIGGEVARATTIVRYAAGSAFSEHTHTGGEEFIVLEGVFSDEHGDFPAGSYIRNPPTSAHTPGSAPGCVIFVKLWQFDLEDRTQVKIDMNKMEAVRDADRAGVSVMPLFQDARETVRTEIWDAGADVMLDLPEGGEFLVLDGGFEESGDTLGTEGWLRVPEGGLLRATAGAKGARVWMKLRHIPHAKPPAV